MSALNLNQDDDYSSLADAYTTSSKPAKKQPVNTQSQAPEGGDDYVNALSSSYAKQPTQVKQPTPSETTNTPQPKSNKSKAGLGAYLTAGIEQGVLGILGGAAKAGAGTAYDTATGQNKGALRTAAQAAQYAFDPRYTSAALTNEFNEETDRDWKNQAAMMLGNVVGEVGKVVATGGTALPLAIADIAAKIGAKDVAKQAGKYAAVQGAKNIGKNVGQEAIKAAGYVAPKTLVGYGAGEGANKALELSGAYDKILADPTLTDQEKRDKIALLSTGAGIAAGGLADRAASSAVKRIGPLRDMREAVAPSAGRKTYAQEAREEMYAKTNPPAPQGEGEKNANVLAKEYAEGTTPTTAMQEAGVGTAGENPLQAGANKAQVINAGKGLMQDVYNYTKEAKEQGIIEPELASALVSPTPHDHAETQKALATASEQLKQDYLAEHGKLPTASELQNEVLNQERKQIAVNSSGDVHLNTDTKGNLALDYTDPETQLKNGTFTKNLSDTFGTAYHLHDLDAATPMTETNARLSQVQKAQATEYAKKAAEGQPSISVKAGKEDVNYPVEYQLMDMNSLKDTGDLGATQNRERSKEAINNIALNPDSSKLLYHTSDASTGAPVVDANGNVLAGNTRVAGLKTATTLEGGRYDKYKNDLSSYVDSLKQAGVKIDDSILQDPNARPVLVRKVSGKNGAELSPDDVNNIVTSSNKSTQGFTQHETARELSGLLGDDLSAFDKVDAEGNTVPPTASEVKKMMAGKDIPTNYQKDFFAGNELTKHGEDAFKNAMVVKAFGDENNAAQLSINRLAGGGTRASLSNATRDIAPSLVHTENIVKKSGNTEAGGLLLNSDLGDALSYVQTIARDVPGKSLGEKFEASNLYPDHGKLSPIGVALTDFIVNGNPNNSYAKLKDFTRRYNSEVQRLATENEVGGMFGGEQLPTKMELVERVMQEVDPEYQPRFEQQPETLFGGHEEQTGVLKPMTNEEMKAQIKAQAEARKNSVDDGEVPASRFEKAKLGVIDGLNNMLDEANSSKLGRLEIENWLRERTNKSPDEFKMNGKYSADLIFNEMTKDPVFRDSILNQQGASKKGKNVMPQHGLEAAAEYVRHMGQEESLSDAQANKFAKTFLDLEKRTGIKNIGNDMLDKQSQDTSNLIRQQLEHMALPNQKGERTAEQVEAFDKLSRSLDSALTTNENVSGSPFSDMLSRIGDSQVDLATKRRDLSNLSTLLFQSQKILKATQGAGFGHVPLANKVKDMLPDIHNMMMKMDVADLMSKNGGKEPTGAEIAEIRRNIKNSANNDSIKIVDDNGQAQNVKLLTNGSPTTTLDNVANGIFSNTAVHGLKFIEGKNIPPASYLKQFDVMAKSIDWSNVTFKQLQNLITTFDKAKTYRKNTQAEVDVQLSKLKNIIKDKISTYYEDKYGQGAGEVAKKAWSAVQKSQAQNQQLKYGHEVFQPSIMGTSGNKVNVGKFGEGQEIHMPQQAEELKATLADVDSRMNELYQLKTKGEQGYQPSRNYDLGGQITQFQKGMTNIAREAGKQGEMIQQTSAAAGIKTPAGQITPRFEKLGNETLQEVLKSIPKNTVEALGFNKSENNLLANADFGEMVMGKIDPNKVIDFTGKLSEKLSPATGSANAKAAPELRRQVVKDISTGVDSWIEKTMVDNAKNGNFKAGYGEVLKGIQKMQGLMKDSPLINEAINNTKLASNKDAFNTFMSSINKKTEAGDNFATNFHTLISGLDSQNNPIQQVVNKQQVIEKVQKNVLNQLADDRYNKYQSLELKDLNDLQKFKGDIEKSGLKGKIANMALTATFVNSAASMFGKGELARSKSLPQQRAAIGREIVELISNPDGPYKGDPSMTNGEAYRQRYNQLVEDYRQTLRDKVKRGTVGNYPARAGALGGAYAGQGINGLIDQDEEWKARKGISF